MKAKTEVRGHRGDGPPFPAEMLYESAALASDGPALVILDEQAGLADYAGLLRLQGVRFTTTRWDVYRRFAKRVDSVTFGDLDFSDIEPRTLGAVYFRIAKEKPVVHHVVNAAARVLKPGGTLHLCGFRKEGTKTYVTKAEALLGGPAKVRTTRSGLRAAVIASTGRPEGELLPDQDYLALRRVTGAAGLAFYSKPGVFGWNKVDRGSALLASVAAIPAGSRVLDLGCGYGYLSIRAAAASPDAVTATDSSAAAVTACRRNFSEYAIPGEVVPSDCGDSLPGPFDVVLCNPPFHLGFGTDAELGRRFLSAVYRLVDDDGTAFVVVHSVVPLEQRVDPLFADIATLIDDGTFKVIRLSKSSGACTR